MRHQWGQNYAADFLYSRALFEQQPGRPQDHDCPDCPAKSGEPCIFSNPIMGPLGPSWVHIRRLYTPNANRLMAEEYKPQP